MAMSCAKGNTGGKSPSSQSQTELSDSDVNSGRFCSNERTNTSTRASDTSPWLTVTRDNLSAFIAEDCNRLDVNMSNSDIVTVSANATSSRWSSIEGIKPQLTKSAQPGHLSSMHINHNPTPKADEVAYVCNLCDKTFSHPLLFKQHRCMHRTTEGCDQGKIMFKPTLESHVDSTGSIVYCVKNHPVYPHGKPSYTCNLCKKVFQSSKHFERHRKMHEMHEDDATTSQTPESCNQGMHVARETSNSNVSPPKKVCINRNPTSKDEEFVCNICDKAFTHPLLLKQHRYMHVDRRNHFTRYAQTQTQTASNPMHYKCNVCEKRFRTAYLLLKHNEICNLK
jgi:hypothetical protein